MTGESRILFVNDDDPFMEKLLREPRPETIRMDWVRTLDEAWTRMETQSYNAVVVKNPLQGEHILDRVSDHLESTGTTGFVVLSSQGSGDEAEDLIMSGVMEYLPYPIAAPDLLSAAYQVIRDLDYKRRDGDQLLTQTAWSDVFIGKSRQLQTCLELASKASETDVSVLVTGETGTGKELLSELIHSRSSRSKGNFVVVDCAALPEHLVESTLYGHEKGSFTSAERARKGLVQEADGGTLFLDEVGELPLEIQKRFLRVLDTGQFRRIGGEHVLRSDFRLIAATNRNLDKMASEGVFREDLLHRLSTLHIDMPPLRDRPEDIEPLARRHLEEYCRDLKQPVKKMSGRFLATLKEYSWPGNVRELFNALERSVTAAGKEDVLQRFHLPMAPRVDSARRIASRTSPSGRRGHAEEAGEEGAAPLPTLAEFRQDAISNAEQAYLRRLVSRSGGDAEAAVKISGISRSRLYALLKEYNLSLKK